MDPLALARNLRTTATVCPSILDGVKRMLWLYGGAPIVNMLGPREWNVRLCYDAPVGDLDMVLRSNAGSDAFIMSEVFDHRYYDIPLDPSPKTILDLGANAGFTAIYFARRYKGAALACVEPMPSNASVLRKNLAANHVDATVFEAAVAIEDGHVEMEVHPLDYGHKISMSGAATGGGHRVEALSVPTLLARLGWERVSLLKLDIEGYESELLTKNTGWLSQVDTMLIEVHDGFGPADLAKVAVAEGFLPPVEVKGLYLLTRGSSAGR